MRLIHGYQEPAGTNVPAGLLLTGVFCVIIGGIISVAFNEFSLADR
jgi:hypothetical protein